MSFTHGEFMLLKGGLMNCRASDYQTVLDRLHQEYAKDPHMEYVIVQVVGTVDKPTKPVVHSVYGTNL